MTPEQQDVLVTIDQLRNQYANAGEAERKQILAKIEALKEMHKLVNCRECKRLCFNDTTTEHWPFCGATCHKIWADKNYGVEGKPKGHKTIAEVQAQINRMKKEAIMKKHQTQQTLYE